MNDILLGVIIGGAIAVAGSAVVAWIQAHYSKKQQAKQIEYEKDSQMLSRRIALRSRYLEPLTSHLCTLYIAGTNCLRKIIELTAPYYSGKETQEIKVPKVDKKEFVRKIDTIENMYIEIFDLNLRVYEVCGQVGDHILINKLTTTMNATTKFHEDCKEMYRSLHDTEAEQDFIYDFKMIIESIREIMLSIPETHERIESLLVGADAGNE